MTISFSCSCGQNLAVRDEHAGKRVRCVACSTAVTVPGGAPPESTSATIVFQCAECGKSCRVRSELAGHKSKCPGCGTIQAIPEKQRRPAPRPAPRALQAEKPK